MRIAYFDCFSGASGDMIMAALLDAGASLEVLRDQLRTLPVSGLEVSARKINKQGFAATSFRVQAGGEQPHRHLEDISGIIRAGDFAPRAQERACAVFRRLAEAEAAVHGTSIEAVHFHEVGAVDAIVDVVGACLALEQLQIGEVRCSAIPTGSGTVRCAHGELPIPAPATAELLKHVPLAATDEVGELTTPTGAAILTTLATSFAPLGAMHVEQIGYGAGTRDGRHRPNLLRLLVGRSGDGGSSDLIAVLEANIDDQSPEVIGHALSQLIERGALDAYCQPIYMKKDRPGVLLAVLCRPEQIEDMVSLIFEETTTFGIRHQLIPRSKLERRHDVVTLSEGTVRIKVGSRQGRVMTAAPEFEDCQLIARQSGLPVKEIMARALRCWHDSSP